LEEDNGLGALSPQVREPVEPAAEEGAHGRLGVCERKVVKRTHPQDDGTEGARVTHAEFLMPKKRLAREAHRYTLRALALRYKVSLQAMEIRLKELGLVCKGMCEAV
jgi:Zn-dependent peptidase ImmA (M78 family)